MTLRSFLSLAILLACLPAARAQQGNAAPQVRAVVVDPVQPVVDLFIPDPDGQVVALNLVQGSLSQAQFILPVNGNLPIYTAADADPKNPGDKLAAVVKLPPNSRRSILVIVPSEEGAKPPYQAIAINDTGNAFPKGESKVLSLVKVETAVQAGEHRLPVNPGKITDVPPVRKVNEFNMAQTNFYYRDAEAWVPITERQLKYLEEYRRIFLIHLTPGSTRPFVTTVLDVIPAVIAP